MRSAERTSALGVRAQIADGVRGPRADASESKPRAVCAAPCLSLHVKCFAGGLAFCVAAQGHAARRRLSDRYQKRLVRLHRLQQLLLEEERGRSSGVVAVFLL